MVVRTSVEGFARVAEVIRDVDLRGHRLKRPGGSLPPTQTKAVVNSIMNARFAILYAPHLSLVEETQRFTALLETFLRENV
jgi:3-oxoadipate enol-lactonase